MTDERITVHEAIRRGYVFGKIGFNHAAGKTLVATLETIRSLSPGGLMSVVELDRIAWNQSEPIPAGDIPMERGS